MKVLLVFPPLWIPYRPYLSLPSLSAYLKSHGVDVVQKDFNVEAYDLLLSESYIKGLRKKLENRFSLIDSKDRLMPGTEQEYYYDLYEAKSSIGYVAEIIEHAKGILRDKRAFYDVNALFNARSILKQAQIIISAACFPSGQDLVRPVNVRYQRSLDDIEKITGNKDENPYLGLYESHLMPFIQKESPDIIGISITVNSQFIPALTLSKLLKSSYKKAHVVMGGHIMTVLDKAFMKRPEMFGTFFDSIVVNEGERPLLNLVEHLSGGQPLNDVPNLIYLDGSLVRANEVTPAEDINALPTPCFDGLPLNLYLSPEPVLPLPSSTGCYWGKCAFCSDNLCSRWRYQSRDAAKVADDMQELTRKYGATHFAFSDEAMAPAAISKLCDEIIKRGMNVRCSTYVRLERQFTPELCRKMYRAGFHLLFIGLESACDRVLRHMNKGTDKKTAADVCKNFHDAGIWNHLLVFFGFPTETRAEAQETIDFLLNNKNIIHSFKINSFVLDKKAPIIKNPEQYGILSIDTGPDTEFEVSYNYKVSSGLTFDEAVELCNISQDSISQQYASKTYFKLDGEDVILYLSHFENTDPYLTAPIAEKPSGIQTGKEPTPDSIPSIKHNVSMGRLRFDIREIIHNVANKKSAVVYPGAISTLFDPATGNLCPVEPPFDDFLALTDGRKSIRQIAARMSRKDAAGLTEEDYMDFIRFLSKGGYVTLA